MRAVLTLYGIASEYFALGAVGPGVLVPGRSVPARSRGTAPGRRWRCRWRWPMRAVLTLYGIASEYFALGAVGPGVLVPGRSVPARSRGTAPGRRWRCRWRWPMRAVLTLYGIASEYFALGAVGPGVLVQGTLVPARRRG